MQCQYLRLSLTLPVSEAVKLHNAAQKEKLAAGDWIAHLLQQNTPVSPERDLSPIGQKNSLKGSITTVPSFSSASSTSRTGDRLTLVLSP